MHRMHPNMPHIAHDSLLAIDLATWDKLVIAVSHKDLPTLSQLLATGDLVPLSAGTGLVVDEDHATLARIRVLDGPASGLRGFVTTRSLQQTGWAA